jgi:hypothetical protein
VAFDIALHLQPFMSDSCTVPKHPTCQPSKRVIATMSALGRSISMLIIISIISIGRNTEEGLLGE